MEFLRAQRDDPDTFVLSPVITAVMTASVITDLQRQFRQFMSSGDQSRRLRQRPDTDAGNNRPDTTEGADW